MRIRNLLALVALIVAAALMPVRTVAQSDTTNQETQELRKQLDDMRVQMDKMQQRLDQLESERAGPTAPPQAAAAVPPVQQTGTIQTTKPLPQAPTSAHVGEQTSAYREFSEDNFAAPRYDNVPTDPKYHGFFYLPGTQTLLKIGGYAKTDLIYDFRQAGNTDEFITSSIPVPQVPGIDNFTVNSADTVNPRLPCSKPEVR